MSSFNRKTVIHKARVTLSFAIYIFFTKSKCIVFKYIPHFFKIGLITKKQTKQKQKKRNKLPPFNAPTILAISLISIPNEVIWPKIIWRKDLVRKDNWGAFSSSVKKRKTRINEGKLNNTSVNFILRWRASSQNVSNLFCHFGIQCYHHNFKFDFPQFLRSRGLFVFTWRQCKYNINVS